MTNESVELKAHKRIWLQQEGETTWCQDKINDDDIEYVLATPPQSPEAKIAEGLEALVKDGDIGYLISLDVRNKLMESRIEHEPYEISLFIDALLAVCETDKEEEG